MEPPAVIGQAIVRRDHIDDAGVCGGRARSWVCLIP